MKKYAYNSSFNMVDEDGNKYLLTVERDDYAETPREWDNIATIWTWHRHYKIGDDVPNRWEPYDALQDLCDKYTDMTEDELADASNNTMIIKLQSSDNITLIPISCYEHGGITISTATDGYPYNDRWDSSMIGFAFVDKDKIMSEVGFECVLDENGERIKEEHKHDGRPSTWSYKTRPLTDETWKACAKEIIDAEVETLDQYLRGDVYSYTLEQQVHYRNETKCPHCGEVISVDEGDDYEEVDSCCGFYGDDMDENGMMDALSGYTFVD